MSNNKRSDFDFKNKTCGEYAYLTGKAQIKYRDIAEKDTSLCRLYILHDNFALFLKNEITYPEFISKKMLKKDN
ncbi:MAG: hypothetical protein ACW964_18690 [Candidatus Hodarchaeales archaeon]|jgi:hypothetical protein